MRDWNKDAQNIANKLSQVGYLFTIKREGAGEYDPVMGGYVGGETEVFSCHGIVINPNSISNPQEFPEQFIIEKGLVVDFVNNGEYTPKIGDIVKYKNISYPIIGLIITEPGGTALLYRCFLKKD